jgi:iron complex outermembrane receptor protein
MSKLLGTIATFFMLAPLYAQQTKQSQIIRDSINKYTDSIRSLPPLEVRSVRVSDNSPFAKSNVNAASIAQVNLGQDLPFLIQNTPSVVVNADAGNGIGYTGLRIRGTDATRINVTLNGIPYNDAESMGTYFVDLPDFSSSANSIQIQRGVGTSTNGASAFGATINLATNDYRPSKYLSLQNTIGSFNSNKNSLVFGSGLINNRLTIDGRVSSINSDG